MTAATTSAGAERENCCKGAVCCSNTNKTVITAAVRAAVFLLFSCIFRLKKEHMFFIIKNEKNTGSNGRAGGENGCT